MLNLWQNIRTFVAISGYFDFARHPVSAQDSALLSRIFPDMSTVLVVDVLQNLADFGRAFEALRVVMDEADDPSKYESEREALMAIDPSVFYITDHSVNHEWVLVRLSKVHAEELWSLLEATWKRFAPKRILKRIALSCLP